MRKINYTGSSKILIRVVELLNQKAELGEDHESAYYGDYGKAAYDHSRQKSGNPHNVTAEDLGLGGVISQINAIMNAIGMTRNWITHDGDYITDHDSRPICFHGASGDTHNYLLYH